MTRHIGTTDEVVSAFVAGIPMATPAADVPGGRRVSTELRADGTLDLYSYRTVVARRLSDGRIAVTPRRYSVTTSKLLGALRGRVPNPARTEIVEVEARVPGRHGGYGIPWHPTGWENLPFVVIGRA